MYTDDVRNGSLDPVLADLLRGGVVKNPAYNPNTKKGRLQPQYIKHNTSAHVYNMGRGIAESARQIQYNNRDLGLTYDEYEKERAKGTYATLSPHYDADDRNRQRAKRQSGLDQFGNWFARVFGGELLVGTAKGISDMVDGVINLVPAFSDKLGITDGWSDGEDYTNPASKALEDAQDWIREKTPIYRKNPNKNFDFTDSGWWAETSESIGSSVALLASSFLVTKGFGLLGKIGGTGAKLSKGLNTTNFAVAKTLKNLGVVTNPGVVARAMRANEEIATMAFMSRTSEGVMEARESYKNVYKQVGEELNKMDDKQYADFVTRHTDIENIHSMSRDDVAKLLASRAANETFTNDYAMLGLDFIQLKSVKNLWKGFSSRAANAGIKNVQESVLNELAGVAQQVGGKGILASAGNYIKRNALNSALNFTKTSISEGFEEFYQGSVQKNAEDSALFAIDGKHKINGISDYLQDSSIWEQAFWGAVGGVVFNVAGSKMAHLGQKLGFNKQQEAEDIRRKNEIKNRVANFNTLLRGLSDIENGIHPNEYEHDEAGNVKNDENGKPIRRKIDGEVDVQSAKEKLFDDFIRETTITASENGNLDLLKAMLEDKRMNQYLNREMGEKDGDDFQQRLLSRMNETHEEYSKHYMNIINSIDNIDDNIAKFTAQQIVRAKDISRNIEDRANGYRSYIEQNNEQGYNQAVHETLANVFINNKIKAINNAISNLQERRDKGTISRAAFDHEYNALIKGREKTLEIAAQLNHNRLSESGKGFLSTEQEKRDYQAFESEINEMFSDAQSSVKDIVDGLPENIRSAYINKAMLEFDKAHYDSMIARDKHDYKRLYDDYNEEMNKLVQDKHFEAVKVVADWLKNQDDLDEAKRTLIKNGVDEIQDYIDLLRLGSTTENEYEKLIDASIAETKKKRAEEEKKRNGVTRNGVTRTKTQSELEAELAEADTVLTPSSSTGEGLQTDTTETTGVVEDGKTEEETDKTDEEKKDDGKGNESLTNEDAASMAAVVDDGAEELPPALEAILAAENEMEAQLTANGIAAQQLRDVIKNGNISVEDFMNLDGDVRSDVENNLLPNTLREAGISEEYIDGAVKHAMFITSALLKRQAAKQATTTDELVMNAITKSINGNAEMSAEEYNSFVESVINEYIDKAKLHVTSTDRVNIDAYRFLEYVIEDGNLTAEEAKEVIAYLYDFIINDSVTNTNGGIIRKWSNKSTLARTLKNPADVYAKIIANREKREKNRLDKRMHISVPNDSYLEAQEKKGIRTYMEYRDEAIAEAMSGAKIIASVNGNSISFGVKMLVDNKDGGTEEAVVEIGFIGTVAESNDGNTLSATNTNYNFNVSYTRDKDGSVSTEIDNAIYRLLDSEDSEGSNLFDALIRFRSERSGNTREFYEGIYNSIKDNEVFNELLNNFLYPESKVDEVDRAITMLNKLHNLIFTYDGITTGKDELYLSYIARKSKFYDNYKNTIAIQRELAKNPEATNFDITVSGSSERQVVYDSSLRSIKDAGLNYESNPIVIITNGQAISENGSVYPNTAQFADGTMGMLVDDNAGSPIMALFKDSNTLKSNNDLYKAIGAETVRIIESFQNKEMGFEEVAERLSNLLMTKGFNAGFSILKGINLVVKDNVILFVRNGKTFAAIHKYKPNTTSRGTGVTYNNGKSTQSTIKYDKNFIGNMVVDILEDAKFNPTWFTIKGTNKENSNPDNKPTHYYSTINGYININIGSYSKTFNNFGHFAQETNAFTTNHVSNGELDGSSLYLSIDHYSSPVEEGHGTVAHTATSLLTSKKQVVAEDFLKAVGLSKEQIDSLLNIGKEFDNPLIDSTIHFGKDNKFGSNAYYKDGKIYITSKGLKSIDNPRNGRHNLIRLLIHENIHRQFAALGTFKDANGNHNQKLIEDIIETFDLLKTELTDNTKHKDINEKHKAAVLGLMEQIEKAYRKNSDDLFNAEANAKFAEEWVTEALSQKVIARILNDIEYKGKANADISGIEEEKKSLFQKIIDSLMKLFKIGGGRVKNNSILARQYYILSQMEDNVSEEIDDVTEEDDKKDDASKKGEPDIPPTTPPTVPTTSTETDTGSEDFLDFDPEDFNGGGFDIDDMDGGSAFDAITDNIDDFPIGNSRMGYVSSMNVLGLATNNSQQSFIDALQARGELIYRCGL